MSEARGATKYYKRSRLVTHLPVNRRYTASHYWLLQAPGGEWVVGLTRFATRMLGDIVEVGFSVEPGEPVALGQAIGFLEGFKAVSDLYSVMDGAFVHANPALERDITLLENDPYGQGWLFHATGTPDPQWLDADGYAAVLDSTIDAMLASRHERVEDDE